MLTDFSEHPYTFPADSPLQWVKDPFPEPVPIRLYIKRDDLLHPLVSGNKWRKLKYNLLAAHEQGYNTLLTFGGAYSNHLYATAAAGKEFVFRTIGVVRGEELSKMPRNKTLQACEAFGMQLHFISRANYRRKEEPDFLLDLINRFEPCYILPEGGTNALAIQGTAEILPEVIRQLGYTPDYVCCPVGTGGTIAGLIQTAPNATTIMGFWALNIPDHERANELAFSDLTTSPKKCCWLYDYHFGGYAKTSPELIQFIYAFEQKTGLLIEQVYTGKMLYGIYDLARKGYFNEGATVVAVHTGGLQGRSSVLDDDQT